VYIGIDSKENIALQSVIQARLETFQSGSICSPLSEADFIETDQNYLYSWGVDYPCHNGIMEKNRDRFQHKKKSIK